MHSFLDVLAAGPDHFNGVLVVVVVVLGSLWYWSPLLFLASAIAGNMSHLPTIVALDLSSVPLLADAS